MGCVKSSKIEATPANAPTATDGSSNPPRQVDIAHWAIYGQPGEASLIRVLPAAWDTKPFKRPVTSPWRLPTTLTRTQVTALLNGFEPRAMEDKWFIYASGPDEAGKASVHFFRSWTGSKFAQLELKLSKKPDEEGTGEVTGLIWENSTKKFGKQDLEAAQETVVGVCQWVLRIKLRGDTPIDEDSTENT